MKKYVNSTINENTHDVSNDLAVLRNIENEIDSLLNNGYKGNAIAETIYNILLNLCSLDWETYSFHTCYNQVVEDESTTLGELRLFMNDYLQDALDRSRYRDEQYL